jgi:manganese/zinc/iron transport system substrate-binding protein
MPKFSLLPLWIGLLTLLGGALAEPLPVVATTAMVGEMVREVGGGCVDVTILIGAGIDPHLYRASAGDVTRLGRARWIVYHGLGLEGALANLLRNLQTRTPTLALGHAIADVAPERVREDPETAGQPDPHLWLDAELWAHGTDIVATTLAELHPDCHEDLAARAAAHRAELTALHSWAQASIASIPEGARTLVTSHDAFAYFGAAYGLGVHGIEGISTESEASIADIRATTALVVDLRVPAIFLESSISPRTIEAVRAAARDQGHSVALGGTLFGDAMGTAGTPAGTIIGMLRHNVLTITAALGGEAAPWPAALADWERRVGLP